MTAILFSEALGDVKRYFAEAPDIAATAARLALNQVASRDALDLIRNEIEDQIDFPASYLKREDRLGVSRKATNTSLEAVITARDRPTSLARFAPNQTPESTRGRGVIVQVKRGRRKLLKKAFLVRLNSGNLGLAIRLKPGETIANKREMKAVVFERGVYLLYGPSVDQVFSAVAEGALPEIGELAAREFFRQFSRLSRG